MHLRVLNLYCGVNFPYNYQSNLTSIWFCPDWIYILLDFPSKSPYRDLKRINPKADSSSMEIDKYPLHRALASKAELHTSTTWERFLSVIQPQTSTKDARAWCAECPKLPAELQGWRILDTCENEDTGLTHLSYTHWIILWKHLSFPS